MAPSQISPPKVGTFPFWAIVGLLAVVHSAYSNIVVQEEVYREAVTDGYIIDNVYLNSFTTESSKIPDAVHASQSPTPEETDVTEASGDTSDEAEISVVLQYGGKSTNASLSAWSTQQPSLESKESDLMEGSGDTTNTSIFLQHGRKPHLSTTTSVSPARSTQESKENDLLEGSGDMTDVFNFLQNGSEPDVSATTSVAPAWSTQESKENNLLEGSGDMTDVLNFLQNGSEPDVSATTSVAPAWSTQEPESKESDSSEGSADTTDSSIFSQHGHRHDVSTTVSITHTQSPSAAVLPGDTDYSSSGDTWSSDGEIIHATTSSRMSGSYTEENAASSTHRPALNGEIVQPQMNRNANHRSVHAVKEHQKDGTASLPNVGNSTPGWIIILAFIVGVAALLMVCIAIATRDKWNAPSKAFSPDSESKMKSINQQRDVEMETFLHKDQPRENGRVTEYTVIPLDELPEKYSSD
ncbi:uncharacterized protein [Takifugu rubripes]|uniref:uncharacterized protein n=1 Tax=Takifugu rubripes TaxID=31033 RepID=UPI0011457041|nr:uncharacterized protein LOC101069615 [Takifugu rubripes]